MIHLKYTQSSACLRLFKYTYHTKTDHSANPSIYSLFKNGIPVGHQSINLSTKKYWHPLVADFLLGIRNQTAIFNPYSIKKNLLQAFFVISAVLQKNGHILIVNTNPEYSVLARNLSLLTLQHTSNQRADTNHVSTNYNHLYTPKISYCAYKWVGGTLTNWQQVSQSVLTFAKFSERCENFLVKHNIEFPRYTKIKTYYQGFLHKNTHGQTHLAFLEKPDVIFLMNPNENRNVVAEANKLNIPVIAFVESNTNIQGITYPIVLNLYSISFIYYALKKIILLSLIYK